MKRPTRGPEFGADFGLMARGTPEGDGAVIPPGRYWLDTFGPKRQTFTDWLKSKPEVHLESSQENEGAAHLFAIFTIPAGASNFGVSGVYFPTKALGFPTVADTTVQSSEDTVRRPPTPTSGDILADAATAAGKAGSGLFGSLDTATIVKFAIIAGVVIAVATFPGALLKAAPRHL